MTTKNSAGKTHRWWQITSQLESLGLTMVLIVACIVGRLLLDQPNFKPSMAAAILAGAILGNWRLALLVPVVSGVATDWILGSYELPLMFAVYACMAVPVFWFGMMASLLDRLTALSTNSTVGQGIRCLGELVALNLGSVLAAVVFYLVTSFVVWCATPWYPDGIAGLGQAYWNAIPFLRWMIQGNLVFMNSLVIAWVGYRACSDLALVMKNAQPALPQ
jgi:hypothetical protein